jgi:DNA-binding transcriptional ArsR family regulator
MNRNTYDDFFVNFANKNKLEIILALKESDLNVSAIVKKLDCEQSAISHNLKKLANCNIVTVRQQGRERIYSLNKDTVLPMLRIVEMHVKKNCGKDCKKGCNICQ